MCLAKFVATIVPVSITASMLAMVVPDFLSVLYDAHANTFASRRSKEFAWSTKHIAINVAPVACANASKLA